VEKKWAFQDCLGLAPELLPLIPQPCLAIVLLYPIPDKGTTPAPAELKTNVQPEGAYFMKQLVPNACGSIAVIHTIANLRDKIETEKGSPIDNFLAATASKSPEERGLMLGQDEAISGAHKRVASKGQTKPDDDHYRSDFHFIVFLNIKGLLVELDGSKTAPITHGYTSDDTFVRDTANIITGVMASNPGELFFSVITLGPALGGELEQAEREEKQISESDVATLVSMGFDAGLVREALRVGGNTEAALEYLISNLN